GNYFLRDQPHAGLTVLVGDRALHAEYDHRSGAQNAHDALQLGGHRLRIPDDELKLLLRLLVAGNQLLPDRFGIDFLFFGVAAQFVATDAEPAPLRLFRHPADRVLRVVARRQRMLDPRERVLAPAKQETLAEFLRTLLGLGDEGRHHIAKIFGTGLIAIPRRLVRIVFPQIAGRTE